MTHRCSNDSLSRGGAVFTSGRMRMGWPNPAAALVLVACLMGWAAVVAAQPSAAESPAAAEAAAPAQPAAPAAPEADQPPSPSPSDLPPEPEPAPQSESPRDTGAVPSGVSYGPSAGCGGSCAVCCKPRCRGRRCATRRSCCCAPCGSAGSAALSPAAAKADPFAWRDLFDGKTLNGWKPTPFGGEGKVEVKDGTIVMGIGNMMTGITCTAEVPRDNYEITLEGKRLEGNDFFCTTTFPVGKDPCTLVMGGWGGTVVGLSNVDYYDASDNATTKFVDFKNDRWYKVRIRVSQPKIEAWIDGEKMVDQPREGHKFGIRWEVELSQPLGVSTWATAGAVRNIRIRRLKPEEIKAIQEETPDDPAAGQSFYQPPQ